ncbi:MAG TPA: PepSY-associated TM helix domain-containing protein [Hymenobacter sp.]|uniref:PepSY-associated TM helix domain-containing protein n=1 Tax=Hymenobacter sp. TaxID=1898978 RepID=UPI002D7ECAFC|nr:PepSY-associated TM helix domain-containing protein [Hymenobacter sp.]HET9503065.1 PepSY-associated TM helix domain-containing protein [Hymenobacter sp.]
MSNAKQGYTFRKLIGDLHLWLGVGAGLVLFVVCLSGTLYTFRNELVEAVEAEAYHVAAPAGAKPLAASTLIASLERAHPESQVTALMVPQASDHAWTLTLTTKAAIKRQLAEEAKERAEATRQGPGRKGEHGGRGGRGGKGKKGGHGRNHDSQTLLVNPYTGAVQGNVDTGLSKFFFGVMGLHRWLLIEGGVGQVIVGISTIIFLVLELSGLVLWAPAKLKQWRNWKMWKPGFNIKWDANWKRINHDLHNTLGFYSFALLTVMALTGLCWSFEWYRNGASALLGAKVFGFRGEKPLPSALPAAPGRTLSADDFLALTTRQLPRPGVVYLTLPKGPEGAATIYKTPTGFFTLAGSDRLTFDQYSGAILKADIFAAKPWNEQLVALIRPLHMGDVYGTFTKILYFIACLIATSLPVTGAIIWLNKLQKKNKRKPLPAVKHPQPAVATALTGELA